MESVTDFLYQAKDFLNPKFLIDYMLAALGPWVYLGLFAIVFAETGLAVGFFLPGDSLLVVAGLFAAAGKLNLWLMLILLFVAAITGDTVGYLTGRYFGPAIFKREKSRLFNPHHLQRAHEFYTHHGGKTIVLARFVPIIRTFAPIVAGAAQMHYRQFAFFNIAGGLLWVASMLFAGYFLGDVVERVVRDWFGVANFKLEDNIDKVIIVVVFLSILPIIFEYVKARRAARHEPPVLPVEPEV